jgi:hypothetical protein
MKLDTALNTALVSVVATQLRKRLPPCSHKQGGFFWSVVIAMIFHFFQIKEKFFLKMIFLWPVSWLDSYVGES